MGGINPGTVHPVSSSAGAQIGKSLRVHEDPVTKQVHFHDDGAGFKFAADADEFKKQWKDAEKANFSSPFEMIGHDGAGSPVVAKITRVIEKGVIDIAVEIAKPNWGPNYKVIEKIVKG